MFCHKSLLLHMLVLLRLHGVLLTLLLLLLKRLLHFGQVTEMRAQLFQHRLIHLLLRFASQQLIKFCHQRV